MEFPRTDEKIQAIREAWTVLLWEEMMNFSWWSQVEFVDEEFLHKKVNKSGVYMRIMVCYRRYSIRYM